MENSGQLYVGPVGVYLFVWCVEVEIFVLTSFAHLSNLR